MRNLELACKSLKLAHTPEGRRLYRSLCAISRNLIDEQERLNQAFEMQDYTKKNGLKNTSTHKQEGYGGHFRQLKYSV